MSRPVAWVGAGVSPSLCPVLRLRGRRGRAGRIGRWCVREDLEPGAQRRVVGGERTEAVFEVTAFASFGVERAAEALVGGAEPAEPLGLCLELTTCRSQFLTGCSFGIASGGELVAEALDLGERHCEFVAGGQGLLERRWFGLAALAGAEGADPVGVRAPFAWPATSPGDRHGMNVTKRDGNVHRW